eukprot:COSAG05_NODE_954_length_6442_cov_451.572915_3_plen_63_part_00
MHGMGDDYGYAETQAPPMNATVYKQRFGAFSDYGFNYIVESAEINPPHTRNYFGGGVRWGGV